MRLTRDLHHDLTDTEALKSLEKMNQVLEQREEDGDKAESVHSAQLEVLDKLLGMSLRTQDIIESKIGVVVSKLRKSRWAWRNCVGCARGWLASS